MSEITEGAANQNAILGRKTKETLERNATALEKSDFGGVDLPKQKETGLEPAVEAAKRSAARMGTEPETTKI